MQKEGEHLLGWIDAGCPNDGKGKPSRGSSSMALFLNTIVQGKEIKQVEIIKTIVLFYCVFRLGYYQVCLLF
jgi:hypothetical protein